jgi:hypothetical protein
MRKLHKGVLAGTVGLALLVPGGVALADETSTDPTPICTQDQRQDRLAVRDELRTQLLDQIRQEGVTDPAQVRDLLRTRLHEAMEARYGELPGPHAGPNGGMYGPADGTGFRYGRTG